MKTFKNYLKYREATIADDGSSDRASVDDQKVFELIASIIKEAWLDNPDVVIDALKVIEAKKPGKYRTRIEEIDKHKKSPYGRGLDKPDEQPHHDIVRPEADKVGDPGGEG